MLYRQPLIDAGSLEQQALFCQLFDPHLRTMRARQPSRIVVRNGKKAIESGDRGRTETGLLAPPRLARKTHNRRSDVVALLGEDRIGKIYELADVYHSDSIERVSSDFIAEAGIGAGSFDNVGACLYAAPSHWDIGKVHRRLIEGVADKESIDVIDALMQVYASFASDKIDDYNSSFYYENPSYILESYRAGKPL